ncbi:hypothetical protein [Natrinema sp. J7-2]|uniref:hypothetical protein n=1 Tax=Natrinema sp. (strain J7-2) TaxID=406552 RepID=UPI0011AE3380|nr:hypothetical protein [Natrinema sp. J7-2]
MERKRLFRLLTAALSVTGISMAVLGFILENPVGVSLGVIAAAVGILFYILEQQTTNIELGPENMDLSSLIIQAITIISLFVFISYLSTSIISTNLFALVVFPSSTLLATSGAVLGAVLGGIHLPLIQLGYYSRTIKRISNILPFGIFAGLIVIFPTTCLPYALSYLICTIATIGYRGPNHIHQT